MPMYGPAASAPNTTLPGEIAGAANVGVISPPLLSSLSASCDAFASVSPVTPMGRAIVGAPPVASPFESVSVGAAEFQPEMLYEGPVLYISISGVSPPDKHTRHHTE